MNPFKIGSVHFINGRKCTILRPGSPRFEEEKTSIVQFSDGIEQEVSHAEFYSISLPESNSVVFSSKRLPKKGKHFISFVRTRSDRSLYCYSTAADSRHATVLVSQALRTIQPIHIHTIRY